ncbi:MAG: VWA domain-containing protein [Deltaproteobacteria bacterium]|nr:VWA domain-containing protein [Deltaproteobacteria bacterium]
MRSQAFVGGLVFTVVSALVTVACGGGPNGLSDFDRADQEANAGNGDDGVSGTLGGSKAGPSTPNPELEKCATNSASAEAVAVYLVFQYDKSGSMGDDGKWNACKAATKAFFSSADSKGISASLTFFPTGGDICTTTQYENPAVPITALPSPVFGTALDGQSPNGSTPTRPALEGAITYAKSVAAGKGGARIDGKVAIVFVTDGVPQGCNNNSIASTKALAASVAATIPTYVIGVGGALGSLDEIAVGGGTKKALIVNTGDPSKTQAELLAAINTIKNSALSCEYKIPAPPTGQAFDRAKVNVQYAPAGLVPATVGYNPTCAGGTGWKYDNETNPTRILFCDATCDQVKTRPGKVDIVFGCATQTGSPK